jgi:hypothetical protein
MLCRVHASAHLKIESYGSAIEDATKAIEIDPTYVKVLHSSPFPHELVENEPLLSAGLLPTRKR